jgi:hypothetical protein
MQAYMHSDDEDMDDSEVPSDDDLGNDSSSEDDDDDDLDNAASSEDDDDDEDDEDEDMMEEEGENEEEDDDEDTPARSAKFKMLYSFGASVSLVREPPTASKTTSRPTVIIAPLRAPCSRLASTAVLMQANTNNFGFLIICSSPYTVTRTRRRPAGRDESVARSPVWSVTG